MTFRFETGIEAQVCKQCNLEMHVSNFWRKPDSATGFDRICKHCHNSDRKRSKDARDHKHPLEDVMRIWKRD